MLSACDLPHDLSDDWRNKHFISLATSIQWLLNRICVVLDGEMKSENSLGVYPTYNHTEMDWNGTYPLDVVEIETVESGKANLTIHEGHFSLNPDNAEWFLTPKIRVRSAADGEIRFLLLRWSQWSEILFTEIYRETWFYHVLPRWSEMRLVGSCGLLLEMITLQTPEGFHLEVRYMNIKHIYLIAASFQWCSGNFASWQCQCPNQDYE